MWVEPVGVEQATAEPVARYKASGSRPARSSSTSAPGSAATRSPWPITRGSCPWTTDPGMCRRAALERRGLRGGRHRPRGPGAGRVVPDPRGRPDPPRPGSTGHRDRRARALEDYEPGPAFWASMIDRVLGGAIKLSPAADFARHFPPGSGCEIDLISLRGECKEATVWFGEQLTGRAAGATWPSAGGWRPGCPSTSDGPTTRRRSTRAARSLPALRLDLRPRPVVDPRRAARRLRPAHGLSRVAEGVDYLTGPERVNTSFLSAFAVAKSRRST